MRRGAGTDSAFDRLRAAAAALLVCAATIAPLAAEVRAQSCQAGDTTVASFDCNPSLELYGGLCNGRCEAGWHRTAACTCQHGGPATDCSAWGNATAPNFTCGAGTEPYAGNCYGVCPAGWHRGFLCTCVNDSNGLPWTDCGLYGARGFVSSCPAGKEYYAGLCYDACPAGWPRTAACTCEEPGGGTVVTNCASYGSQGAPNVPRCPAGYEFEGDRCWAIQTDCPRSPSCGADDPTNPCHPTYDTKPGEAVWTGFLYGRHCGLDFGGGAAIDEVDRCCSYHDGGRWLWNPRRNLCETGGECSQTVNLYHCFDRVSPRSTSEARARQIGLNDIILAHGAFICGLSLYDQYGPHSANACRCYGNRSDFDLDAIYDHCDDCRLTANPDQADADGDHAGDACDNCPAVYNFSQADDDHDGIGNECDACTNSVDGDCDGVLNATDICPTVPNADQADTEADGVGDACDNCVLIANGPKKPDAGGASRRDTDGDGYGNACDADLIDDGIVNFKDLARMKSVFFTTDGDADLNGDGIVNFADLAIMKQSFFKAPGPAAGKP